MHMRICTYNGTYIHFICQEKSYTIKTQNGLSHQDTQYLLDRNEPSFLSLSMGIGVPVRHINRLLFVSFFCLVLCTSSQWLEHSPSIFGRHGSKQKKEMEPNRVNNLISDIPRQSLCIYPHTWLKHLHTWLKHLHRQGRLLRCAGLVEDSCAGGCHLEASSSPVWLYA